MSSSPPVTAHLIARRLRRYAGIPWVADFRDPWSELLPPGSLVRRRASRLERSLAQAASAVVMTSPSYAARHAEKWGRPVAVITNGHGVEAAPPIARPDRFVLSYLGSYYPETQDLTAVWTAIQGLARAGGPKVEELRFIGDLHPTLRRQLADHRLDDLLAVTGFLPYEQAIASLRSSSVLLIAGPRSARGLLRGQLPGKVFDYLATGLPIVYVGDPEADAAELLRRFPGCHVAAADDADEVGRALVACRDPQPPRDVSELSRRALTGRLARLLDEAAGVKLRGAGRRPRASVAEHGPSGTASEGGPV